MGEPLICETALPDETATVELAGQLAAALPDPAGNWLIALQGELGAGKSTFARAMLRRYGHDGPVPSPTYTLVEPYDLPRGNVYHIDLYRVSDEEELRYLGWNELDEGFRLVEWPSRAPQLAAGADLQIELSYSGEGRNIEFTALSDRGRALAEQLNP